VQAFDGQGHDPTRLKFLATLGERLRGLSDHAQIVAAACAALGRKVGAARVGYAEVMPGGDAIVVRGDWSADETATEAGRASTLDQACGEGAGPLRQGHTVRIAANETAGGVILAPLVREDRLWAVFYLHGPAGQDWSEADLVLTEVVAERLGDVLERTRAQGALRESEARFRAMADSAPAPVWVTSATGGIEFVNQAFTDLTGLSREGSRGDIWLSLLHPDDVAEVVDIRAKAWTDHSAYSMEARFRSRAGDWLWMQCHSKPRVGPDGEFQGYVGLAIEQTEARATAAALRESEERFRVIAESAPVMIWMTGTEASAIFLNRAQREFFGLADGAMNQNNLAKALHPDDADEVMSKVRTAHEHPQAYTTEARMRRADGAWRILHTRVQPRFAKDGAYLGLIGVNIDVTEARLAEENQKRINELLADRVAAALADKEQAEAALFHAQKLEAVGRLTGGVAHDFNNLLTVVIGSLDLALKRPDDLPRTVRMMEAAMSAARRGERLTDQLLSFSRRQALRPEACDLNVLVRESEPLLRRAVGESVHLVLDLSAEPVGGFVDSGQFVAGLLNLVVNARDATPDGGTVTVETGHRAVSGSEAIAGGSRRCVYVRVRDTGSGMPPQILERAFEPFFTTKALGKGTGLGLSQVYSFAHQSGGGALIESPPGQGATVEIYLPEAVEPNRDAPEVAEHAEAAGSSLRILFAEDDPSVGAIGEEMLQEMGHRVVRAHRADEALALLGSDGAFDLLITDLVMPGAMTGMDLARTCAERHPHIMVILASGYIDETTEDALADTPWPVLHKPYSAAELTRALGDIVPGQAPTR
jgi:PAS domain S-box-containing protein